jgi:hypothetical protein
VYIPWVPRAAVAACTARALTEAPSLMRPVSRSFTSGVRLKSMCVCGDAGGYSPSSVKMYGPRTTLPCRTCGTLANSRCRVLMSAGCAPCVIVCVRVCACVCACVCVYASP